MFILLLNICNAVVSVQKQEFYSTTVVQNKGKSLTKSAHHKADVTQVDEDIWAHETRRNMTSAATPQKVNAWHHLIQKSRCKGSADCQHKNAGSHGLQ